MKKYIIVAFMLVLVACSVRLTPLAEGDLARAQKKFPGITLADLQEGELLYINNCGKCHRLKQPSSLTESEWREIVPPMAKKAKITDAQETRILKYVVSKSKIGS